MNSHARAMKADITIPDQLYSWDITYSGINYPWTVLLSLLSSIFSDESRGLDCV